MLKYIIDRFIGKVKKNGDWCKRKERLGMKLSARNTLKGKVVKLTPGAVNTEVQLELPGGDIIVSVITKESAEALGLAVGKEAYAVIKASNVMLGID